MKVYLDSIGCRLNQSEIESIARQFRVAGHEIVPKAEMADLAVVNTCAVTNEAASDSRGKIRQIARASVGQIIPTGCWTTLQPREAAALPNVARVVSNDRKDYLVQDILLPAQEKFDIEPLARLPLPGLRKRTRAFTKVQDGCDNHCTFCVTTVARGRSRSRSVVEVIQDVLYALRGGVKEIVLTGVHLGAWGQDFGGHLRDLIAAILKITDIPRIRLSSLEPWDLNSDFFSLWEDKRLMPHLHLPLQSGCSATLRRMARKTTPSSFRELVSAVRGAIPEASITTDIITGFPGESDEEFAESLEFVKEMSFAGGHVFSYSLRPDTTAARMKGQVKPEVRKERNHIMQHTFEESAKMFREKFIGRRLPVLWESSSEMGERGWQMEGLTGNYIRVTALASSPRWNVIDEVELIEMAGSGLKGTVTDTKAGLV